MKLAYGHDGRPIVLRYEPGDLVRLIHDERGDSPMGIAGDWGCVAGVAERTGSLTITLGGYSRARSATVIRLTDMPAEIVRPCDDRGHRVALRDRPIRSRLDDPDHPSDARRSHDRRPPPAGAVRLPAWAPLVILATCALTLTIALAVAARTFGMV